MIKNWARQFENDARKEIAIKYEFVMNNLTMSGTQQPYCRRAHIMSQMGLLECEYAAHRKRTYRVTSQLTSYPFLMLIIKHSILCFCFSVIYLLQEQYEKK